MVEKFQCLVLAALSAATFCAQAAAAAPTAAAAAPAVVAGFSYVKSQGGIDEYTLDGNGLTVLLVPDHSAPVVTFRSPTTSARATR